MPYKVLLSTIEQRKKLEKEIALKKEKFEQSIAIEKALLSDLENNEIIDFVDIKDESPFKLEFLDVEVNSLKDLCSWVENNDDKINNQQILMSIDYMLDESYYDQRFKNKFAEVYFYKHSKDAILSVIKIKNSISINCTSYNVYKECLLKEVFK